MERRLTRRQRLRVAGLSALHPIGKSLFPRALGTQPSTSNLGVEFINIAGAAGLSHKTIYGGEEKNSYLLETTGCGVAFFDFDNDGWRRHRFRERIAAGGISKNEEPTNHLYKNNRDGTFNDVTVKAGLARLRDRASCYVPGHD